MAGRLSRVVLAVALVVTAGGAACSGGSNPVPLGMMRSGEEVLVFIGRQCVDAEYPTRVRVVNYDEAEAREAEPPLWEVTTSAPTLLPSVSLGRLPTGFTEVANNINSQGIGPTVKVEVDLGEPVNAVFDTARLAEGRVLQSNSDLVSLEAFRRTFGCTA
jgi:hypothetical protein